MGLDQPRLIFKHLNGFQAIDQHGKIKTILFLNASREVVSLIGKFYLCCPFSFAIIISLHLAFEKKKNENLCIKIASVESPESSKCLIVKKKSFNIT